MLFIATTSSLEMAALPAAKEHLKDMNREEVIRVGIDLGLSYSRLQKMRMLPEQVIVAWLRGDDKCGLPSWNKLAIALENNGHTTIASKVRNGEHRKN